MDLVSIRKKARTQDPAGANETQVKEIVSSAPAGVLLPSVDSSEERFWEEIGTEQFATEEEYTQSLSGGKNDEDIEQVQWLGFYLGREEYALELEVVSELIKPRALTELPQVPGYIRGIISLRGEVIPVIDLKCRLGLKSDDHCDPDLQRVVVCDGEGQRIGLLVDRISQVVRLSIEDIETPQLVGDEPSAAYIQRVGRKHGQMLIQLNSKKALEIDGTLAT